MSTPEFNFETFLEDFNAYITHAKTILDNWNLDVFGTNPVLVWFQDPETGVIPLLSIVELARMSNRYPGCGVAVVNALIERFKEHAEAGDQASGGGEEEARAAAEPAEVSEGVVDAGDVLGKAGEDEMGGILEDQEREPEKVLEGEMKEGESEVIDEVASENASRYIQRLEEEKRALRQEIRALRQENEYLKSQL